MGRKTRVGGRVPHPHLPHLTLEQVRVLRLFALLFLFSLLVLYAVFRSSRFQELLRKRTETLLAEKLGRRVTIGGFDLSLVPPAFVVRDVAVANDPRGIAGPCFAAEEVSLRGIPQVSETRVDLPKVRVLAPRIVLEVFGDGTTNFSSIAAAFPKGEGKGRDVRVREAVLQRGTIRFREWKAKLDVILSEAALTARSGRFSRTTRASLGCRRARFKLDDGDVLDLEVGADVVLSPGRVRFRGIRLRGDGLAVDALGGIDDLARPEVNLLARVRARGEDLDRYFGAGVPLSGPVSAVASVRVPPGGGFRVRGKFEIGEGGRFGPFPMTGEGFLRVPWKSLILGRASDSNLSRNSHFLIPLRVTEQATGIPSRSLKPATDFLARLSTGRWPVIWVSSLIDASMNLMSTFASPTPMLTTTFSIRGACITFL